MIEESKLATMIKQGMRGKSHISGRVAQLDSASLSES